jgi:hypothetical protein
MWVYYYRLCDKYGPAVVSLAMPRDLELRFRTEVAKHQISIGFGCPHQRRHIGILDGCSKERSTAPFSFVRD